MSDPLRPLSVLSSSLCVILAAPGQDRANAPAAPQQDFVQVAKKVFPSIVTVRTFVRVDAQATEAAGGPTAGEGEPGWIAAPTYEREYPGFRPHGSGSGFFFSKDGDVLTGLQPLQLDGDQLVDLVEVETVDGHRILCDVVGIEPTLHLAVLRNAVYTSVEKPTIQPLEWGDSDAIEVGSFVLGFGDPFGPERFIGTGLLVAKPSRDCYQELMSATYMQATMFVPPGAFGGPLVDPDGRVVGMLAELRLESVGAVSSPGSAWALPSKILSGLAESIRVAGTMQSPFLGFSVMSRAEIASVRGFQTFQKMQKPPHGILVENVFDPSPASAAGIQPDDFLTHFDGVEIHMPVQFQRQLYLAGVGRTVELTLFRAGETFTKELQIVKRPDAAKPK